MRYQISAVILFVVLAVAAAGNTETPAQSEQKARPGQLVKLRMIVLKNSEDARGVLNALDGGTSFIQLAREVSVGPSADRGGHIGTVDVNRLKPELRDALKGLKPGQHTGAVETALGLAIFQVTTDQYYEKGLELFDKARYQDAIQEFKRDLELNPDSAFSFFYLGLSQNKLNQNQDAAKSLETAARLKPDMAETYYNLGRVHGALGKADDAEKMYRKTIEMAPDFHMAYNNLAWLLLKDKSRVEEGIKHAKKAIELSPTNPTYYHTLAMLYKETGRKDEAVKSLKMAVKLAPDDTNYKEQLAYLEGPSSEKTQHAAGRSEGAAPLMAGKTVAPAPSAKQAPAPRAETTPTLQPRKAEAPASPAKQAPPPPQEKARVEPEKSEKIAAPAASTEASPPLQAGKAEAPAPSAKQPSPFQEVARVEPEKSEKIPAPAASSEASPPLQAGKAEAPAPSAKQASLAPQEKPRVEPEKKESASGGMRIKVLNGNGIKGSADKLVKTLEAMHYRVEEVGNADKFDWARTTVLYRPGKVDDALALARKIPGEQDVIKLRGHEPFDIVVIVGEK